MEEIYLNRLNMKQLSESIDSGIINKVIIPFGSCEAHGAHLPLGTDTFISTDIAERLAKRVGGAIISPPIPFGTSINYNQYPLSLSLGYDTTIKLTEDILSSFIEHGLKNLIILNGHDGNIPALEIASRNIKNRYKSASIIIIPGWWFYSRTVLKNNYDTWDGKGHGGEAETSLMLEINPELVNLEDSDCQIHNDVIDLSKHGVMVIWDIEEVSNTGSTGDSKSATKEKGKILIENFTEYLVDLIRKLDNMDWNYDYKR